MLARTLGLLYYYALSSPESVQPKHVKGQRGMFTNDSTHTGTRPLKTTSVSTAPMPRPLLTIRSVYM